MLAEGIRQIGDGLLEVAAERLKGLIVQADINEIYEVEQTPFARGKFAAVRRAVHKQTGVQFAAKFLRRRRRAQCTLREIGHEIAVLMLCADSKHIVQLHAVHESRSETALILELATGGELQALLDEDGSLSEAQAQTCMREILKALQYMHAKQIAHLDLKPQNILLCGDKVDDGLKLCDFGISRLVEEVGEVREILGTPDYVAPEVLQYEPLSLATDIWSIGVLAYVLLTGCSPFGGDTKQETFLNISQCALNFPEDLFEDVSEAAQDFIKSALRIKPKERMTATECLSHHWLRHDPCALPIIRMEHISPKIHPKDADEDVDDIVEIVDDDDDEDEEEDDADVVCVEDATNDTTANTIVIISSSSSDEDGAASPINGCAASTNINYLSTSTSSSLSTSPVSCDRNSSSTSTSSSATKPSNHNNNNNSSSYGSLCDDCEPLLVPSAAQPPAATADVAEPKAPLSPVDIILAPITNGKATAAKLNAAETTFNNKENITCNIKFFATATNKTGTTTTTAATALVATATPPASANGIAPQPQPQQPPPTSAATSQQQHYQQQQQQQHYLHHHQQPNKQPQPQHQQQQQYHPHHHHHHLHHHPVTHFPDAPTTPKVCRKSSPDSPPSVKALVKKFQPDELDALPALGNGTASASMAIHGAAKAMSPMAPRRQQHQQQQQQHRSNNIIGAGDFHSLITVQPTTTTPTKTATLSLADLASAASTSATTTTINCRLNDILKSALSPASAKSHRALSPAAAAATSIHSSSSGTSSTTAISSPSGGGGDGSSSSAAAKATGRKPLGGCDHGIIC